MRVYVKAATFLLVERGKNIEFVAAIMAIERGYSLVLLECVCCTYTYICCSQLQ